YDDEDWHQPISKAAYLNGLVMAVDDKAAVIKIGPYGAVLPQPDFAWTGRRLPSQLLHVGDIAQFYIRDLTGGTAHLTLAQDPGPQSALVALDNGSGEVKAMVGGYSFEDSKFNRATQAQRQVGSSFKVYVYAAAL